MTPMTPMAPDNKREEAFQYEKALKQSKPSIYSRIQFVDLYLNRPIAALIVQAVYNTSITPNGLTYISFFMGILAAYFFSRGEAVYFILGGVFAQLSSIIDGADGMLARAKKMCSDYGANLDLFFDRILDFFLFVGIAVGANRYFKDANMLFLGLMTAGLYLLQINLFYLTKSFLQVKDKGDTGEARAILMWFVLISGVVNRLDIFIYVMLTETVIVNMLRLRYFISLRDRSALAFSQSQQPVAGHNQGNNPPDQHQG